MNAPSGSISYMLKASSSPAAAGSKARLAGLSQPRTATSLVR